MQKGRLQQVELYPAALCINDHPAACLNLHKKVRKCFFKPRSKILIFVVDIVKKINICPTNQKKNVCYVGM